MSGLFMGTLGTRFAAEANACRPTDVARSGTSSIVSSEYGGESASGVTSVNAWSGAKRSKLPFVSRRRGRLRFTLAGGGSGKWLVRRADGVDIRDVQIAAGHGQADRQTSTRLALSDPRRM